MASEIFVNPQEIRNCVVKINSYADNMEDQLNDLIAKIESTASTYQADSANDMRDKFNELKPEITKFTAYLRKVANYLNQNVAEPAEITDAVAQQNVASIHRPQ